MSDAATPQTAVAQPAKRVSASSNAPADIWAALLALAAIWWIAIDHLRVEWSINEQYSYGWFVPWLALYLFALRWRSRPPATAPRQEWPAVSLLALLATAWLPAHLLQVSSPDWRLIGWALSSLAVAFTLGGLYLVGGPEWLRHFCFPVVFMLVAVPWPVPLEQRVIQSLMRVVAATSVEALHWCGYPAVQQGNLIDLGRARLVGVEDACSGVRSVQTMLMAALFLGELWYRRFWKRVALIAAGLAVAFVLNVGRAFTLAWLSASRGTASVDQWHDRVGLGFLALMLVSFTILAFLCRDRNSQDLPASSTPGTRSPSLFSWRWSASLLAWLLLVWAGTEFWYRSGENLSGPKSEIVIHWPEGERNFKEIPIPSRTGIILRHDEGRSATWVGKDGATWSMVYLRWKAGSAAVQLARAHTPDVCLPAAGGHLEEDRGVIIVPAGDLTLPAHTYTFTAPFQRIHVFYIRVGDDAGSNRLPADIEELTIGNRIRAALARRRNRGQQVVEVAITSIRPPEDVTAAFKDFSHDAFRIAEIGR